MKYNLLTCVHPVQCEDGDVRLVEGESEREGRVEVCINKRWGSICSDGWSNEDATTVCIQLGYWDGNFIANSDSILLAV